MKIVAIMTAVAAVLAAAAPASASTLIFQTNFDSLALGTGSWTVVQSIEGWTATAGAGIEVQNHAAGTPFSESNLVEMDSHNNSTMSRIIGPGSYTLTYEYSPRPGVSAQSTGIDVLVNSIGIDSVALNGVGNGDTVWSKRSVNFALSSPGTLSFAAVGTNDSYGGYLDNVTLTAVPEPASWALMLAGFGMVGAAARRRRTNVVTA